jgi:protein-disulfide isomerase
MKRYLPLAIILGVLLVTIGAGLRFYRLHQTPPSPPKSALGKPGAEPAHRRGKANASVTLEQFGDFECLPCFILWPSLKNVEHDYAGRLAVIFRQRPLPQHHHALEAARASEAAGLQKRFWEMHDLLYLNRSKWVRSEDVRTLFNSYASELGLDVDRFKKDMDGDEVTKRINADQERAASLGIDRTPVIFINEKRIQISPQPEEGLHQEIDAALSAKVK